MACLYFSAAAARTSGIIPDQSVSVQIITVVAPAELHCVHPDCEVCLRVNSSPAESSSPFIQSRMQAAALGRRRTSRPDRTRQSSARSASDAGPHLRLIAGGGE